MHKRELNYMAILCVSGNAHYFYRSSPLNSSCKPHRSTCLPSTRVPNAQTQKPPSVISPRILREKSPNNSHSFFRRKKVDPSMIQKGGLSSTSSWKATHVHNAELDWLMCMSLDSPWGKPPSHYQGEMLREYKEISHILCLRVVEILILFNFG